MSRYLYFLLAAPIVYGLIPVLLKSAAWRKVIILFHACILTILSLFVFNEPGWRWSEQIEYLHDFGTKNENKKEAYGFIGDNFVLIDNTYDKLLIPDPEGDASSSTNLVITDRKKLVAFLHLCNTNPRLVDFVVSDLGFSDTTASDHLLYDEMDTLYSENKLLVSFSPKELNKSTFRFNPGVYGDVREEVNEGLFVSHLIKREQYFSLPYKIYCRYNNINKDILTPAWGFGRILYEPDENDKTKWILNRFQPEFSLTNESRLLGKMEKHSSPSSNLQEQETSFRNYYKLGEAITEKGAQDLLINLQQRREQGKRNIIFLGAFDSPNDDVHQTPYGQLHGSTILLNVFYQLQQHRHYIGVGFIFLLFTCFLLITWALVHVCLHLPINFYFLAPLIKRGRTKIKMIIDDNQKSGFKKIGFAFLNYLGEEFHFILLLLMLLFINTSTNHLINGFALLIYFGIISSLLKQFRTFFKPLTS